MKQDLVTVNNGAYSILAKTKGERWMLFFTVVDGRPLTVMMGRNENNLFVLDQFVAIEPKSIWLGTILDGEMIEYPPGHFQYQVFDVVMMAGNHQWQLSWHHRIEAALTITKWPSSAPFQMVIKNLLSIQDATDSLYYMRAPEPNDYPIDGLILLPTRSCYQSGKDYNLFKFKEGEDNTVDFYVQLDPTTGDVYFILQGEQAATQVSHIVDPIFQKITESWRRYRDQRGVREWAIAECKWNASIGKWGKENTTRHANAFLIPVLTCIF
jgi:hypothetical protein